MLYIIEINEIVRAFIDRAAGSTELSENEYIDHSDGLIHCKKCGGRRQTILPAPLLYSYLMPLPAGGRETAKGYGGTESAHGESPCLCGELEGGILGEYWSSAFGDVRTGKSFFAGCIANALIDRDIPVLMTNIPSILNRLTEMFAEDRATFISALDEYSLLILDDLGVEQNTEYALEQMFLVIDSRYRRRKLLIVTTNLKLEEIKKLPDLAHARICDLIMERCASVLFSDRNFREEKAAVTKEAARGIVPPK